MNSNTLTNKTELPVVSIITVVLNAVDTIENTIQSVISQTYGNIEYVVIDGDSTDGTTNILAKYNHAIDKLIIEKDDGIFAAMNKGITLAEGEVIGFLNAGDTFYRDAVENSMAVLSANPDTSYTYSSIIQRDADGNTNQFRPLPYKDFARRCIPEMPYPHMSAFIKHNVFESLGLFDTKFRIGADHDMAIRIIHAGYQGIEVPGVVGEFLLGGASGGLNTVKEIYRISIKHGSSQVIAATVFLKQSFVIFALNILPEPVIKLLKHLKGSRFS